MMNRSASLAMSASILKALPGKLDIKRHSPSILYLLCTLEAYIAKKYGHRSDCSFRAYSVFLHSKIIWIYVADKTSIQHFQDKKVSKKTVKFLIYCIMPYFLVLSLIRPWGYNTFFMRNSAEHELYPAYKR